MKNKKVYIYTHQGLGDQLICNGLIREAAKKFKQITIFSKQDYLTSVQFMYRDLNNVLVIPFVNEFQQVPNFLATLPSTEDFISKIGFNNIVSEKPFDEQFYSLAGLSFEKKWSNFYVQRDLNSEKQITKFLNPNNKDYIFVHEDRSRNYCINYNNLPQNIKIIKPILNLTNNIFDYIDIILNAKEIHCIDSAFLSLIELIQTNNTELVFHKYSKYLNKDNSIDSPVLRKQWKIIR